MKGGSHKVLVYLLKNVESDQSLIDSQQHEVLISASHILIAIQLRLLPSQLLQLLLSNGLDVLWLLGLIVSYSK